MWQKVIEAAVLGRHWTPVWRMIVLGSTTTILIGALLICGGPAATMVLAPAGLLVFFYSFAKWSTRPLAIAA